ncbi:hypothetical protein DL93DRAFT_2109826 [Clavulina sp. PMI_390]|nr:hypothetical protein DL93DRAFT_2109826 [Clavulina sp. PMI_390]
MSVDEATPRFQIVEAGSKDLIEKCKVIRIEVFVNEQQFPLEAEIDEYDEEPTTIHLLCMEAATSVPVGTLRMYPSSSSYDRPGLNADQPDARIVHRFKLGRVCILQRYRKFKLGSKMIEAGHALLRQRILERANDNSPEGPTHIPDLPSTKEAVHRATMLEVHLHSQIPAIGFYERCGYKRYGDEFMEDGASHMAMLARLPLLDAKS